MNRQLFFLYILTPSAQLVQAAVVLDGDVVETNSAVAVVEESEAEGAEVHGGVHVDEKNLL